MTAVENSGYVKIQKRSAKKMFDKGVKVFMLPNKARLDSMWINPMPITNEEEKDFEKLVNNYSYYNCNKDLGHNVAFYIKKEEVK